MASLKIKDLVTPMLGAASKSLKKQWPGARDYAASEFRKIAESIVFIESQVAAGKMTRRQAQLHLRIQRHASQNVLLALEGLGILAVEEAINAALGAIKDTVNTALGLPLL